MLLLENKYDLFKKVTYDKKSSEYDKELKKYEDELAKELSEYEKALEKKTNKALKKEKYNLENKRNEKIQILKTSYKESILKLREELIDDLSAELARKYKKYVKTDEYFEDLKSDLQKFLDDKSNTIYLVKDDIRKLEESKNTGKLLDYLTDLFKVGYSNRIKELDDKEIGGFVVVNEDRNTIINNSVSEYIKQDRNAIGLIVQEFINEVGAEIE